MKCPKCGAEGAAGAEFCHKCGAPLKTAGSGAGRPATEAGSAKQRDPQSGGGESPVRGLRRGGKDEPEEVLWEGNYSAKAMISTWIIAGVVSVVLAVAAILWSSSLGNWQWLPWAAIVVLWVLLFLRLWLVRLGVHYKLTTQRFIHEKGILRRSTNRIEVIDIDDVSFEQGIIDRMLEVGRIQIISSDRSSPDLWLEGVDQVKEVANLIDGARRKERARRGLYVENV